MFPGGFAVGVEEAAASRVSALLLVQTGMTALFEEYLVFVRLEGADLWCFGPELSEQGE